MTRSRPLIALASFITLGACLAGCGGTNTDRTGPGEGGLGPAGTNGTNLPQTPEEQFKKQQEDDAAFRKTYKPK